MLGGTYALVALGLTLQYGVSRIMNLASGETLVAACFIAFWLFTSYQVSPLWGLLLIAPAAFVINWAIYTVLLVVYTTFRGAEDVRRVAVAWAIIATASGAWGFVQFWQKRSEALSHGFDFYLHYVGDRATGFMSHWMTFSAEQMMAGLLVTALLLYGTLRPWVWLSVAVIAGSIAIAWTRGVWIATGVACVYLIAVCRPKLLILSTLTTD